MFDAITFDVAMVTKEGWERLNGTCHYNYAWRYDKRPADDVDAVSYTHLDVYKRQSLFQFSERL